MFNLLSGIVEVVLVGLVHAASEHEVVPQQDPVLVGKLVEVLGLVNTTFLIRQLVSIPLMVLCLHMDGIGGTYVEKARARLNTTLLDSRGEEKHLDSDGLRSQPALLDGFIHNIHL